MLSFPGLELRDYAVARKAPSFPYIPGLLSFRETRLALAALGRLAIAPDLLFCDGQGIAQPRPLVDRGECIGAVLRTRAQVKPVYVSIGHRVSLETAIEYVMACAPRYRLPETIRWAHQLAHEA